MCTVGVVRSVYLARCISANVLPLVYREDAKLAKAKAKQMVPEIIHLFDQIDIDAWWKDNDFLCFDVSIVRLMMRNVTVSHHVYSCVLFALKRSTVFDFHVHECMTDLLVIY